MSKTRSKGNVLGKNMKITNPYFCPEMYQLTAKPRNTYQVSKPNPFYSHKPHCHSHIYLNQNKRQKTINHGKYA